MQKAAGKRASRYPANPDPAESKISILETMFG
jgi:hypothetical protein